MGTRSVHMTDVFVGIDVSKATLDVMVLPEERYFQVSRDEAGVEQLLATLKPLGVTLIVLEATGGLERPVVMALAAAGLQVVTINPRQAREFARARSEEHTSELQSRPHLVCRLLL